ncbi:MAG: hypothetical protein GQ474_07870 [Sulfurimonas sp.]|nr:hypothetical protein [Sulfurimonas sp.]
MAIDTTVRGQTQSGSPNPVGLCDEDGVRSGTADNPLDVTDAVSSEALVSLDGKEYEFGDFPHVATRDVYAVQLLQDLLVEMRKMNIQLAFITNVAIEDSDIKESE